MPRRSLESQYLLYLRRTITMDMMTLWYTLAYFLYTECIAGVIINLIIVAANVMKWRIMKSLNTADKILSSLATSRGLYLLGAFLLYLSSVYDTWDEEYHQIMSVLVFLTIFMNFTNLWLATVLCVFYCVKITSYSWKFFIFLKTKISTLVPWFLVASLLISLSSSLPFALGIYGTMEKNLTNDSMENMNHSTVLESEEQIVNLLLISSCPPFLVFLVANFLLLHSLWMHTRRMRGSGSSFRSPNLESHFSAVKSMSLFLVLETIYFLVGGYSHTASHGNIAGYWITFIVTCSPPVLHSLYIISSNSELKKTFVSMFHGLTCGAQG